MDNESRSLGGIFREAEHKRRSLDAFTSTSGSDYQEKLRSAINKFLEFLDTAERSDLFSPNESVEDIASGDLQYLLPSYYVAELTSRLIGDNRKSALEDARRWYRHFLQLLDSYDILPSSDEKLLEQFKDAPDTFSTASTTDAAARRETKISRFRKEKELKRKIEYLQHNPAALDHDEEHLRDLHLANVALCVHNAFQSLESIAQELQILAMAPPHPPGDRGGDGNDDSHRQNGRHPDGYSERLDAHSSRNDRSSGPILSGDGKPLRPFTLLDTRQRLRQGVFRPDHNLPTMTIDEYLEEERRRGGIIDGGGEQSGIRPEPDEDDLDKADEETLKARAWDEFKEANPKGSGNTINRG